MGFFQLSLLPSCNQGCCFQVVLAAKPCFDLARDHLQTCQECSCSCSLLQSRGSISTTQLQDYNQQHPLTPSPAPSLSPPLLVAFCVSHHVPALSSHHQPFQLSFLKEMPRVTCQSFPKQDLVFATPGAEELGFYHQAQPHSSLLYSELPLTSVDTHQGGNSIWYLQT